MSKGVDFVLRPFEGLPGETDLVALREVVPAATATARTTAELGARDVVLATVLPMAWPALHRGDGAVMVGLQQNAGSGDASRDLAVALLAALDAPVGTPVQHLGPIEPGPRLQDVLDLDAPFEVTVHEGFDFWTAAGVELTQDMRDSLDRMNESVVPTARLAAAPSAYWARMGDKEFLRWALPHDEDAFLDALARLHARRESGLGPQGRDGRYVGAFRSCGIVVPVWDLAPGTEPEMVEEPLAELAARLEGSLAVTEPLDATQRRARAGLVARQLTLR
ncbi:DUF5926 family protein [Isoptericola sp. b441]|uniref:DUF5926 family protein n=1 Tax=Actinotalea lenta TaxID=3064654 RepID=A0ABT9D5C9_9CELL|nr:MULTISPECIES: DUF5926 family protein [unclassified Isoptericola]MDO8105979.1 DUF5926 family protein [Isoptericola sp. b441]MDO8122302.1 DUF5926 family protein [Isoptericola sp. b490]